MKTRIFYSCDAHGSTAVWKKWLSVPKIHEIDVLMLCGDLTGKAIVPIVDQRDGTYLAYWAGTKRKVGKEEIAQTRDKFASIGYYSPICSEAEITELRANRSILDSLMSALIVERMREWMDLLVEKVDLRKIRVIAMPGNDDSFAIDDVIKDYGDRGVIWPLGEVIDLGGFDIASLEYVNPTPWDTPREATESDLERRIDELMARSPRSDRGRTIFNFHCPPFNTAVDLAPKLDKKSLRADPHNMRHVGSQAVRRAIERYKPMIGLHGHIHESCGEDRIGMTPVVNPGSEYGQGVLRGYTVELSDEGSPKYWRQEG